MPGYQSADASLVYTAQTTSVQEQATRFYFKTYIMVPAASLNAVFDAFSHQANASTAQKTITDGVVSVGLAGFSNVTNSTTIMSFARSKFTSALSLTGAALANPDTVNSNDTLRAVMLLAIFEVRESVQSHCAQLLIADVDDHMRCPINTVLGSAYRWSGCPSQEPNLEWYSRCRGKNARAAFLFHCKSSLMALPSLIVCMVTSFKLIGCLEGNRSVPQAMIQTFKPFWVSQSHDEIVACELAEIASHFVDVRASLLAKDSVGRGENIVIALDIEHALVQWQAGLPSSRSFATISSADRNETFNVQTHVYPNLWTAKVWNFYKAIRIMVNDILLHHLTALDVTPAHEEQQIKCLATISQMAADICASVAFHLQYYSFGTELPLPKASPVFNLLLPLNIAGSSVGTSEALHDWLVRTLQHIGDALGIRMASSLATKLTMEKEQPERDSAKAGDERSRGDHNREFIYAEMT